MSAITYGATAGGTSSEMIAIAMSGQHGAAEEEQQAVDGNGPPVGERRAQARQHRLPRPAVLEHDQRRREPDREQRGQRDTGSPISIAPSTRELATQRFVRLGARRDGVEQHAAVDERRRQHRERRSDDQHDADRQERPEIRPEAAKQVADLGHPAAFLRPCGGQESRR